jgi:DNA primase
VLVAISPARLSPDEITRIRSEHRIVDVLRRCGIECAGTSGRDVMISCPTPGHEDSTPSCIVHPVAGTFYCFGCGVHGDVFTLVREISGVTNLTQAAELLDSDAPISWRSGAPSRVPAVAAAHTTNGPDLERTSRQRIIEVNGAAWSYLTNDRLADQARAYLARRRIDLWAVESWARGPVAGHTPASRTGLTYHLRRLGFTNDEIVDAGWTVRRVDGAFDRFHRRVLLPIRDADGQIAGVIGRDITDLARCKYLNMPRTAAYSKGHLLYDAPTAQRSAGTVIVCEGPLDALAITAAAHTPRNLAIRAVAPCGTALTHHQAQLIASINPRDTIICADGDAGGTAAAAKWQAVLHEHGLAPRVITLPAGHDPASWLAQNGPSGFDALAADSPHPPARSAEHPLLPARDVGLTA